MKKIDQWTIPNSIYDSHVHMDSSKNYSEEINFWIEQMERYNVDKITVLTRDLEFLEELTLHPKYLIPCLWIDPLNNNNMENFIESCKEYNIQCVKLYPPHGFHPDSEILQEFYSFANDNRMVVNFHMGISSALIFTTMRFMNPELAIPVIEKNPNINFLFAHFAPGYFQELIRILYHYPNVYAETSSSNDWIKLMKTAITLRDIFAKTIDIAGTERIIFGTDSGDHKRGWRSGIYKTQLAVCNDLGLNQEEIDAIFFENFEKLLMKPLSYKDYMSKAKKLIEEDSED